MKELNQTIECMENQLRELKKIRTIAKEDESMYEAFDKRLKKIEDDIAAIRNAIV